MRRHPRYAEVNPDAPSGWGTCEACGFVWNLRKLEWNMDWRGLKIENLHRLVCPNCVDTPQRQLGAVILSADPLPLVNARPEQYPIDEEPVSAHVSTSGTYRILTQSASALYPSFQVAAVAGTINLGNP